ncbi:MAG: alpha/beta hydrolase [Rhodospirillaceae bacterium]|nr:MAG: alpha/beta hydrolase [Rhodospirillaceae bacterium]
MSGQPPNDSSFTPSGTRALVAPELRPVLDVFPSITPTDEGIALIRSTVGSGLNRPPLSREQQEVRCEERLVPGSQGAPDVRVLVYTPPGKVAARPAFLHMHGGGYVLGTPELGDISNRTLAIEHGCVVVAVGYRLAPETRFPGALEDCYAALRWLHAQAKQLGVDRSRIAIGGESAGGGHAAALALLARDRGEVPICLQLLDSPMLDDRTGSSSGPHPYCGEFIWTSAHNRFGWRSLLGMEPGGADVPLASVPARAANLAGLPPTFIVVGALDLFLEEDIEYARRLIRAGVPTELHVIPGAFHGFGAAGGNAPQVQALLRFRRDALARAFAA